MTRLVEESCIKHFIEEAGLLVNITARTKGESSLKKKLRRMMERGEKINWNSADDVFDGPSDFCGVRIAYYSKTDQAFIENGLEKIFQSKLVFDRKDKYDQNSGEPKFYKATHCQVAVAGDRLEGDNSNLEGLTCEIQICSMMEHVWNEIEHDIGYKPRGTMSSGEIDALTALGILTRKGDAIIEDLIGAHQQRIEKAERIDDTHGFVEFVRKLFNIRRITFRENAGNLLEALQRLELDNKSKLCAAMGFGKDKKATSGNEQVWKTAQDEIGKFNTYLRKNNRGGYVLNKNNSMDPVLMLVLMHSYKDILKTQPAGRGKGRPSRTRSLATQYQGYLQHKKKPGESN